MRPSPPPTATRCTAMRVPIIAVVCLIVQLSSLHGTYYIVETSSVEAARLWFRIPSGNWYLLRFMMRIELIERINLFVQECVFLPLTLTLRSEAIPWSSITVPPIRMLMCGMIQCGCTRQRMGISGTMGSVPTILGRTSTWTGTVRIRPRT